MNVVKPIIEIGCCAIKRISNKSRAITSRFIHAKTDLQQPPKDTFGQPRICESQIEQNFFAQKLPYAKLTDKENGCVPAAFKNTKAGKTLAKLAEKMRSMTSEQMFIIDENGHIMLSTENNKKLSCAFTPKQMVKLNKINKSGKKYIAAHNHPCELTLSSTDLATFKKSNAIAMIAFTKGGGYACVTRTAQNVHIGVLKIMQAALNAIDAKASIANCSEAEVYKLRNLYSDRMIREASEHSDSGFIYEYVPGQINVNDYPKSILSTEARIKKHYPQMSMEEAVKYFGGKSYEDFCQY